jgi:hypothetical protein
MNKNHIALILSVLTFFALMTGCSAKGIAFQAVVSQSNEVVLTASEDIESQLKTIMVDSDTPLFKDVSISESKGLFYNSYTLKAVTNTTESKESYTVQVTMPGSVTQAKDGVIKENTVTFQIENFSQENEIATYSESNNYTAVIVILLILVAVLGAFIYFTKMKG